MPPKQLKKKKVAAPAANSETAHRNLKQYMAQVNERIPPIIHQAFFAMYNDAVDQCVEKGDPKASSRFHIFQQTLSGVKTWDEDTLIDMTEFFEEKAPWMRTVLRQILVANVHILLSMQNDRMVLQNNFQFEMPSDEDIVFHLMRTSARAIRPHARLFDHKLDECDIENNAERLLQIIRRSVESSITTLVPLEEIVAAQQKQQGGRRKNKKGSKTPTEQGAPPAAAAASEAAAPIEIETEKPQMEDGVKEGDSENSQFNEKDLEALRIETEKRVAEEAAKQEAVAAAQHEAELAQQETLKIVPVGEGERPVDEPTVDELLDQLEQFSRDDPRRAALKKKIKALM